MALKKEVRNRYGTLSDYWRITKLDTSFNGPNKVSGNLSLYVSQSDRDNGYQFCDNVTFSFQLTDEEVALGDVRSVVYSKLKESILVDEGENQRETNYYQSVFGPVYFQDAIDV